MTPVWPYWVCDEHLSRPFSPRIFAGIGLAFLLLTPVGAVAQDPNGTVKDGFAIHQSVDLGGRIVSKSGSDAMYDTLVNLQSGPRVLNESVEMHAIGKTTFPFFDTLTENSTGYGGDPNDFTMLKISKGKLYDFYGLFRRDRQYFDYDLLDNPLIPSGVTSNGYTFPQVLDSPHLFNTVRRMTDVNMTILPLSKVSFRAGYSQNIMQGPTGSSIHEGTEALLLQNWRNSTDSWNGAVDWKPLARTTLTYEEYVTHYKGNTTWQLTGLNLKLSNGRPVTLGYDNTSVPVCTGAPIVSSTTNPPTANATCNGFLQYERYAPTRTLFPTEELRFQSSSINTIQMSGRIRYTGATMNMPNFYESFNGLETRTTLRALTITGSSKAQRVNVSADYGIVWQISGRISLTDQFDFWDFRQPSSNYLSEIDQDGSSMLNAPGPPLAPSVTSTQNFLGQKTETNTLIAAWDILPQASVSLGYRYRARFIDVSTPSFAPPYTLNIYESAGLLGVVLRPMRQWNINGNVEASYADTTYTQISPRALQHYKIHSTYKPKDWAMISGTFNDLERRNNVYLVNHLDHSRSFTAGASLTPNERYGLDLSYGYIDVFSQSTICYDASPAPVGAIPIPSGTGCGSNIYLANDHYDAPTQYGAIGIVFVPMKRLHSSAGYRMSAVNGTELFLNSRQVPGSLQSKYQSPYATAGWTLAPGWIVKADWNYYGYGEGGSVGPTLPRNFHGNSYTSSIHYEW